jgi:hypothetical protein
LTQLRHQRSNHFALRDFLLDHLVGGCEERFRHLDAEQPRGLKVDDELELGRLMDRQVGGLCAPERRSRLVARSLKGRLRKAVGYSVTPLAESKVWAWAIRLFAAASSIF